MPIYMDAHIVPGVKAKDVAEAHRKDLLHQDEYGCKCMTYWIDEKRESIFCLIEAPDKDAVKNMHQKAHGLVPNKILEVSNSVVESFLGRIYDPSEGIEINEGLKVFHDPSFRILVVSCFQDFILLKHTHGVDNATVMLNRYHGIIRNNLLLNGGREVEHPGNNFIISFSSAKQAVNFAKAVWLEMKSTADMGFSIAVNAGEPIGKTQSLFGDSIRIAENLCNISNNKIAVAAVVKQLLLKDNLLQDSSVFLSIPVHEEQFLELLYAQLEKNWKDNEFDTDIFCRVMALSTSQLYRKSIALTGKSPNLLLKDFRLQKAKELIKQQYYNICQITFDAGFSSPSYFTKCFKKKFGLLPMAYRELLD